jgi:hypothetical protein
MPLRIRTEAEGAEEKLIPNFPENPFKDNSNSVRMSFWRDWLKAHPEIKTILELGRGDGFGSCWYFVESGCEVWSVDLIPLAIEDPTYWNTGATQLRAFSNFHEIVADDTQPIPEIDNKMFDLVFLDTSHGYEHTKYELKRYFPMATKWFLVDDYHWSTETPALEEFAQGWKFVVGNDIYGIKK